MVVPEAKAISQLEFFCFEDAGLVKSGIQGVNLLIQAQHKPEGKQSRWFPTLSNTPG